MLYIFNLSLSPLFMVKASDYFRTLPVTHSARLQRGLAGEGIRLSSLEFAYLAPGTITYSREWSRVAVVYETNKANPSPCPKPINHTVYANHFLQYGVPVTYSRTYSTIRVFAENLVGLGLL